MEVRDVISIFNLIPSSLSIIVWDHAPEVLSCFRAQLNILTLSDLTLLGFDGSCVNCVWSFVPHVKFLLDLHLDCWRNPSDVDDHPLLRIKVSGMVDLINKMPGYGFSQELRHQAAQETFRLIATNKFWFVAYPSFHRIARSKILEFASSQEKSVQSIGHKIAHMIYKTNADELRVHDVLLLEDGLSEQGLFGFVSHCLDSSLY